MNAVRAMRTGWPSGQSSLWEVTYDQCVDRVPSVSQAACSRAHVRDPCLVIDACGVCRTTDVRDCCVPPTLCICCKIASAVEDGDAASTDATALGAFVRLVLQVSRAKTDSLSLFLTRASASRALRVAGRMRIFTSPVAGTMSHVTAHRGLPAGYASSTRLADANAGNRSGICGGVKGGIDSGGKGSCSGSDTCGSGRSDGFGDCTTALGVSEVGCGCAMEGEL